jgi:outer membrane lipoprotein SlyB
LTLYLLNFKNYFNREIERWETVGDYQSEGGASVINTITNMTLWNPNDGVNTVITTCWYVNTIPNYVVISPDDSDDIQSRWWVIKHERIAGTQYRLYLRRDLIADNLDLILNNEHSYITRGWCPDTSDLIYNAEDITCNQIKTLQYPLCDDTGVPWIVIYLKKPGVEKVEATKTESSYYKTNYDAVNGLYDFHDPTRGYAQTSYFGVYWRTHQSAGVDQSWSLDTIDDCPYAILTVPYTSCVMQHGDNITEYTASDIITIVHQFQQLMGDWIMDIQMSPYCPLHTVSYDENGWLYFNFDSYAGRGLIPFFESKDDLSYCYGFLIGVGWSQRSEIPLYHRYRPNPQSTTEVTDLVELKVWDIKKYKTLYKYRLCSPNGSSIWEFNISDLVAKAKDTVKFYADITLQPYNIYLNIYPSFGRLYGKSFKDYRGLLCSGDFALPQISDAWINYIQNNKCYESSFNRSIESLTTQQEAERVQEGVGIATSAIATAASGAFIGAKIGTAGGPVGAGIGAGVGLAIGAIAGGIQYSKNEQLRAEELDATIDQHNYQLKNISAQPTTISNVNTFNVDNTYFPILEVYNSSACDEDRYERYITEKGYNISTYGALSSYTKAGETWFYSLIPTRLSGFTGDSEMLSETIQECKQGFYYKAEGSST